MPASPASIPRSSLSSLAACLLALAPLAASAATRPHLAISRPTPDIVQVYGGCGPYAHRSPAGFCRPGGQANGYFRGRACPRGYHIGPYRRRCLPN